MKKLLSLLLILLLSVTLMSGCFKKADKTATNDTTNDVVGSTDETEATTDEILDEEMEEDADLGIIDEESDSTGSSSKKTDSTTAASYEEDSTSGSKTSGSKTSGSTGSKTDSGTSASYEEEDTTPAPKPTTPKPVDTVTAASTNVTSAAVLTKSLGKDGKWIVAITKNITSTNALVMEGNFKKTGTDTLQRKLALYTQDDAHKVTAEFKLTAPKITIKSPNARIQNGTFVGDIYVQTTDFQLVGTKVIGNVYFINQAAKDGFKMDDKSSISGKQIVSQVDTVTAASTNVTDAAVLEKSLGEDGKWIVATTKNITTTKELVMEGDFKKTGTDTLQRKLALYTQDDAHKVTAEFKLTAPKITIKSPNARIQNGTFVGDIYVETTDFQLVGTKVIGNVYFINQAAKDGFKMDDKSSITSPVAVQSVDSATAASLNVQSATVLQKSLGTTGKWIVATTKDIATDKALVMEGDINKTGTTVPQRKLALYAQDDAHKVTAEYKLTAPKITIKSITSRIQNGTFVGDIYVESPSFKLVGTEVIGNVYFASNAAKAGFTMESGATVSGSNQYLYK